MFKIVASDMDETFLASDHSVPQANVEAIARLRDLGCLFVPASGRAYRSVMGSIAAVPPQLMEGSYVVSYNGGCINRYGDPTPLTSHSLPFGRVEALFAHACSLGLCSHIYEVSGRVWINRIPEAEAGYLAGHMEYTPFDGDSIDFLRDVPLAKILYCLPHGMDRLRQVLAQMPASLTEGTSPTFSSGRYLEFNPQGVDKGAGLRRLAGLLGVGMDQVVACGDAANDIPMVEAAGVGVAVANAADGLPQVASYLAHSSNDDGIIAEVADRIVAPANQRA